MEEVARRMAYIYPPTPSELPGIDLHPARQGQLLGEFEKFYADRPLIGAATRNLDSSGPMVPFRFRMHSPFTE